MVKVFPAYILSVFSFSAQLFSKMIYKIFRVLFSFPYHDHPCHQYDQRAKAHVGTGCSVKECTGSQFSKSIDQNLEKKRIQDPHPARERCFLFCYDINKHDNIDKIKGKKDNKTGIRYPPCSFRIMNSISPLSVPVSSAFFIPVTR